MTEITDIPQAGQTLGEQIKGRPQIAETEAPIDSFKAAVEGPPNNLSVNFDRLINARNEMSERITMKPPDVLVAVSSLNEEQAKEIYEKSLKRIWEETGFLQDFQRTAVLGAAVDSFVRGVDGIPVKWNPELKGPSAVFDLESNTISADGRPVGSKQNLVTLGARGELPASSDAIKQVLIRSYPDRQQSDMLDQLKELSKLNENVKLLMQREGFVVTADARDLNLIDLPRKNSDDESYVLPTPSQAKQQEKKSVDIRLDEMRNATDPATQEKGLLTETGDKSLVDVLTDRSRGPRQSETMTGFTFVQKFIEANPSVDPEKLTYTINAVDQLQALGIPATTIAEILKDPGEWVNRKDSIGFDRWEYKTVQDLIDGKAALLSLDELDVQGLVDADRLERQIDKLHVMDIFQQELKKSNHP